MRRSLYFPWPTNQRAEIMAVILALEKIIEKYDNLRNNATTRRGHLHNLKYALGCMATWIYKWVKNGFINAAGHEVTNRDLIEKASNLDDQLAQLRYIKYVWIPREENEMADCMCNQCLDEQEAPVTGAYPFDDFL